MMGRSYQNRKESIVKTSDAKAKIYSKYGREIYVCAKSGGVGIEANLALRSIIDRAKKDQVPNHVIQKALDKVKGGSTKDFLNRRYEGYGPGNIMIMVDCLTNNHKRTFGDVRVCFTKAKCKMSTQGSVSHMFDHCAILAFNSNDEDSILESLILAGVDVTNITSNAGKITVSTPHTEYFKVKQILIETFEGITFDIDGIHFIPQSTIPVRDSDADLFKKLINMLNDLDDVQNIYHNAKLIS